jgi:hypothetical protein
MKAHTLASPVSLAMLAGLYAAFAGPLATATSSAASPGPLDKRTQRFGVDGVSGDAGAIAELGDGWSGINGVTWQQIEPRLSRGAPSYNWQRLDDIARRFQPTGRRLQLNFRPLHEAALQASGNRNVLDPSGKRMGAIERVKPEYLSSWRSVVQALVERYDHDGNADMPGLRYPIVTHIQIDSEPENTWADAGGYIEALCAAYEAAKSANPEAQIMAAGFNPGGFFALSPEERRQRMGQATGQGRHKQAFITEFLANGSRCYDILSLHLRELEGIPGTVEWFNDQMRTHGYQKPIWSDDTMSGPSLGVRQASEEERRKLQGLEQNTPAVVEWFEQEQADNLVKKAVSAFGEGVEKVFISTDVDWPNYHMAIWRHMGLLDARGRRKPAFTAFKTTVEQLEVPGRRGGRGDGARVRRAQRPPQPGGGGLHAFEFAREGRKIVVVWNDGEGAVDLTRYLGSRSVELVDLRGQRSTTRTDSARIGNSPVFLQVE